MIKQTMLGCFAALSLCGQASFANSPAPGPLFNITKTNSSTLQITPTNPNRDCYDSAGIKTTSSFATFVPISPCTPNTENNYCLFSACRASVAPPAVFSYRGPAGAVNLELCLNGKGKTAGCQNKFDGVSMQYAYVAESIPSTAVPIGRIWQCGVNPNGSFGTSGCTQLSSSLPAASSWNGPSKISFTNVNSLEYAYVADGSSSTSTGDVYTCSINLNGETFITCAVSTDTTNLFSHATQVAFATISGAKYAYVSDAGSKAVPTSVDPNVWQCRLSSDDGSLLGCNAQLNTTDWNLPMGVTTEKTNNINYAYVSDPGQVTAATAGSVVQCPLDSQGQFPSSISECNVMVPTTGTWRPMEVAFQSVNGTRYAYIADSTNTSPGIWKCNVSSTDGSFNTSTCIKQTPTNTPPFPTTNAIPAGIAFATVNEVQYAYVSYPLASVYQCTLLNDGTGSLNACTRTPSVQALQPNGVTILSDANQTAPHS